MHKLALKGRRLAERKPDSAGWRRDRSGFATQHFRRLSRLKRSPKTINEEFGDAICGKLPREIGGLGASLTGKEDIG
jgi:hypothetical protein